MIQKMICLDKRIKNHLEEYYEKLIMQPHHKKLNCVKVLNIICGKLFNST
jgi:hypothetical protein